jgi:hypothetical protein
MGTVSEPGVLLRDFPFAKSGRGAAQNLVDKGGGAARNGTGKFAPYDIRPPASTYSQNPDIVGSRAAAASPRSRCGRARPGYNLVEAQIADAGAHP